MSCSSQLRCLSTSPRLPPPRSSLHPIITLIAHSFCGWAVCAIAVFAGYIIYTLYVAFQGSGDKQTPTSPKGPSPNSWSSVTNWFWSSQHTNDTSSSCAPSTGPQPSSTSPSYLGKSLSYVGGWARWFGGGCANLGSWIAQIWAVGFPTLPTLQQAASPQA